MSWHVATCAQEWKGLQIIVFHLHTSQDMHTVRSVPCT